jgi:3-oxoacyl-[acyl-carrier-protein] synthase-3
VESGQARHVLVIGAEKLTAFVDWTDRTTCVLFGDGAGAAVVGPSRNGRGEILSVHLSADGTQAELLRIPGGGSRCPTTAQTVLDRQQYLKMAGKEVYKIAVKVMTDACQGALKRAGLTMDQCALLIPHQANMRIIVAVRERLELPEEKVFVNIERVGNTSAASVAIALDEAVRSGRLKQGDPILMVAFGAGLTLAASVIRW